MRSKTDKDGRPHVELDMICICREDGQEEARLLREEAMKTLELKPEDEKHYVTNMVAFLWHDYGVTIDGMYSDMWFLISATSETEDIRIQCDTLEDGFTAIWKYVHDKKEASSELSE